MKSARSQRFSRPLVQYRHSPHVHPSHGTPSRLPSACLADDLVARDERQLRVLELPVDDVEVGAADAAREHPQQDLARGGLGDRGVGDAER